MFPSKKELSVIKCSKGANCALGATLCPFSHLLEREFLPPLSYFTASKRRTECISQDVQPKRTREEPQESVTAEAVEAEYVCPRLPLEQNSRVPWKVRQASLEKIFVELGSAPEALSTEMRLYNLSQTKQAYSNNYASLILKLRQRKVDTPGGGSVTRTIPIAQLREAIHSRQVLSENGYLFTLADVQRAREKKVIQDESHLCDRCKVRFIPSTYYKQPQGDQQPCRFHFGPKIKTVDQRLHSCCHQPVGELGCTTAPAHVFSVIPALEDFCELAHWPRLIDQRPVAALDVEMIYTVEGQFPARVSIVDWQGGILLDVLVKPPVPVVDFNTRYSGIRAEDLQGEQGRVIDYHDLYRRLKELVGPDTILIGHSLENDMLALRLISDQIIDTAILFPHPQRQEAKLGLKELSKVYLREFIQEGSEGHCSIQDALTCLKLVKSKIKFI